MEKIYDPQQIEAKCYQTWEKNNYFYPNNPNGKPYTIMLPPPNVTGSLHMGHGFQHTLMDALTRYHRMCSDQVLWQPGTDHAGIATQMVVERQLLAQGVKRHDLGREKFIEKVWEWKAESGGNITRQMRRMGSSVAWTRERFTMDPDYTKAVEKVFIDLYKEGLIYRSKYLVNWDPQLLTAISDLEVISTEEQGHLWHIRYPLASGKGHIVVATTRPETMLGDVAVAVHPDDERYKSLIGQQLKLPLADRAIPIIADNAVDLEFGTGCVKITPAHDFNDYAMGQRHKLDMINIFTPDAHINENAPAAYRGMERFAARKKIVADLEQLNLIEKIDPHTLKVPRGDRSGVVIEPYLTDQWFMKMQPLAEPAIAAVKDGTLRFIPEGWTKTYLLWLENIQDWCISRQLWWGHRIPAWYDDRDNIYVGNDEQTVRRENKLPDSIKLRQETDVLDTWFSSALWPFATLGWPENTKELATFYPTSVLVTGFDIIFFWVARMVMLGLKLIGKIPFQDVYITGLIRDQDGQKMSKTKGNVLDPLDIVDGIDLEALVEKRTTGMMQPAMAQKIAQATRKQFPTGIPANGTDALRFTFCALASPTRDIRFDLARVEGYRNFCNKLWNAARYVLMNTEEHKIVHNEAELDFNLADRWILSRLQNTIQQAHQYFKDYRFDLLAQTLYEFTWNEYCDWYLELAKPILMGDNFTPAQQNATRYTLLHVLEVLLRLFHPLMPYITEEIWQRVAPLAGKTGDTIMLQAYPQVDTNKIDSQAVAELEWLKNIITGLRSLRSEMRISPAKVIPLLHQEGAQQDQQRLQQYTTLIKNLAKVSDIKALEANEQVPASAMVLVGELKLFVPLAGLIDLNAEQARINKEINQLDVELQRISGKLANPNFVSNAPAEVVAKEQARKTELETAIEKLKAQLTNLQI